MDETINGGMEDLPEISIRYKTLPLSDLDSETISRSICDQWNNVNNSRSDFMADRQNWTANWRDVVGRAPRGPWDNASDFHVPMTLIYGKAVHARLWQLFSDESNFFGVKARTEALEEKEQVVKDFMQFILTDYSNSRTGTRDTWDEFLWDNVFDGSGFLKLYWHREVHEFVEVEKVLKTTERKRFDFETETGVEDIETELVEEDQLKTELLETPHLKRVPMDDICLPVGEGDPQTSSFVSHIIEMTDEDLKYRARDGKFDSDATEEAIKHRNNYLLHRDQKRQNQQMDGYCDTTGYLDNGKHMIIEWYGKEYIKRKIDGKEKDDLSQYPREIVAWVHQASGKMLGWTYLHRISPGGIRPIFKSDFIRFPDRSTGVGAAEYLYNINEATDSVYNMRMDSGRLASTPMGVYRSNSGLKAGAIKIAPGTLYPVDDPNNDVKIFSFPFLTGFGQQEEAQLKNYAESGLNLSELQIGGTPTKVGVFRTASGANQVEAASGIQLEIHFDRLARTMKRVLQALFVLCRERVPAKLAYRITGENAEPIFGRVNRDDLKGQYDFEINLDVLGQTRLEQQQSAVLVMNTLMNPAFTQGGVVNQENLYNLARNFLLKHRIRRRIDDFITPPQGYQGPRITTEERIMRVVVNNYLDPMPIWDTVRLDDNHEQAIRTITAFESSDSYGFLNSLEQARALQQLKAKHEQLLMAQQAGGAPQMMGQQVPREGAAPPPAGPESVDPRSEMMAPGPLGAPQGEVNGPVL